MPSTAVVADTTSYLPRELLDKHDIKQVSLYVGLEGEQEREADITDLHAFYERLRISDQTVTTSQPSVGDFISVYEPLLAEGKEIVSIHLSSGISGTYESAMQARDRLTADGKGGERIKVCDSRTGAGGMGLMILAAANAAENGGDAAEAMERAEAARAQLKIWFAVDTLDYLRRGGRIGAARAWIGTTLKIKPILTLRGGDHPDRASPHPQPSVRADGRLRAPAPRGGRGRLGGPARPGPGDRRAAGRGLQADLRLGPGLHL